jgi:predicted ATPase
VLDNCEHLAATPAQLASMLLESCPHVRILATSRHPLRLPGEVAWRVPGLAVPEADAGDWLLDSGETPSLAGAPPPAAGAFPQYPGVELFLERARAARREFRVAGQAAATVAGICRRLDGIPLAIELAAAHVRSLPLEQIAARLDNRFRLLTGGSPAPPRHETLRATMDWSYQLLTEPERALLRSLAVFVGGFSFAAAERVGEGCPPAEQGGRPPAPASASPASPPRSSVAIDDALTALVDQSLVLFEEDAEPGRYRLLETVRQYAWERLEEAGEAEAARERHGRYFLDQLEAWQAELGAPAWFHHLAAESPNVMAALEWALARPEQGDRACHLGAGLTPFWARYGSAPEGARWWARALSDRPPLSPAARVVALRGAAWMALCQGDRERAQRFSDESIAAARALRDPGLVAGGLLAAGSVAGVAGEAMLARAYFAEALALTGGRLESRDAAQAHLGLGWVCQAQGDLDPADAHAQIALAGFRRLGDAQGAADALHLGGSVLRGRGLRDAARARLEESLAIRRECGDLVGIGWALNELGDLARAAGDGPRARALFEESLAIRRAIGDRLGTAGAIGEFGYLALDDGDLVEAETRFEESLAIRRAIGEREGTARMLLHLGALRQLAGDPAAAFRLLAESLEVAREVGHRQLTARALTTLAILELRLGHSEPASQRLHEALPRWQELGDPRGLAWTLEGMAELALAQDAGAAGAERAAALVGTAAVLREAASGSPPLLEQRGYEPPVATARARLDQAAFDAAWTTGRATPPDQVATAPGPARPGLPEDPARR